LSNLRDDTAAAMIGFAGPREGGIDAVFLFAPELAVFSDHFPGHPILPGILELEMVLVALSRFFDTSVLRLVSIERAKFLGEIKPGEKIKLLADFSAFDEKKRLAVKGQLWVEGEKAAHIELTVERDE